MSDSTEDLRQELQAAQRTIAGLQEQIEKRESTYRLTTLELEESRSALLIMLEDLEAGRKKIERAHQEWITALDAVNDPIFLHDKNFRILRCNKAYQQCAGLPFHEIIGLPYYEVFPKADTPLPSCLRAMEKAEEEEEEEVTAGGTIYRSRAYSIHDKQGTYLYSVHIFENITERRRIEAALHESEEKLRKITESAQDAIIMMADKRISFWNASAARIFGYTAEEALGKEMHALIAPPRTHAAFAQGFAHFQGSGEGPVIGKVIEIIALRKGGEEFPVELSVSAVQFGGQWHAIGIVRDITERKRTDEELRLRAQLLDSASDTIFVVDFDGNFVYLNEAAWKTRGYTRDEMMAMNLHVLDTPKYERLIELRMRELMEKGQCIFESEHRRKDGSVMPVEINAHTIESGGRRLVLSVIRDISERKQAEEALRESEEKYRSIYENAQVGLYRTRISDGKLMMANDAMARMFGFDSIAEATAKYVTSEHYVDRGTRERLFAILLKYGRFDNFEARLTRNDGMVRWFRYSGRLVQDKGYIEGVATDITEPKEAEVAIQHANRALATLSAVNSNLVHIIDENELLQAVCDAIVEQEGYRMVWVGYRQHDEATSIKIMARAGYDEGYLDSMQLTWAETERGMGPSGRAMRSGTTQLCQDIANDPQYLLWRDAAIERGYAASIALPLNNGEVFGILHVYSAVVNDFTPNEITLLEEMAGDLAFGVRALLIRRERDLALEQNQQHLKKLRNSLEDTVRAIASIAEMRDPYTAGHQVRVADLAAAIAKQMGLPEEQVHAIHLAGTVHDLGKIKVPAEILSKPGKITDLEFGLIKIHPQASYDILKGIDFPWPIAQMVLQHHERLDGSGYPQGLKGEAILLEARILAVADMVEAMTSHRPYRPGFGIDVALEEIIKQRGIRYDSRVVDACLTLFSEQGYTFK